MSLYEVLNLFLRWPLVFRSFLHPPLVVHDVVTPVLGCYYPAVTQGIARAALISVHRDTFTRVRNTADCR